MFGKKEKYDPVTAKVPGVTSDDRFSTIAEENMLEPKAKPAYREVILFGGNVKIKIPTAQPQTNR